MIHKIKKKLKDKLTVKEIYTEQIPLLSGKLLEGRTALITGGGGGIGGGIARAFVNQGAEVIITGRNEKRLKETCEELNTDALCADYVVWDHSEKYL
ncbi:MAG: SDR family NAD(P)-dependent oxidoreductase [Lachnospiraceae bacterium]|nr:SDR family NAD(P)-dependent oxidoreductase [Lachnospiraceae bacterium]